jgi:hypothetical protein
MRRTVQLAGGALMRSVVIAATLLSFAVIGSASAQAPLVVNVTPSAAPVGAPVPAGVGVPVVIDGVTYDRVPVRVLFITGPRYTERSGVRIGRGSVIPDWLAADPMRNVSIRRLQPGSFYRYFVSPDDKVVIFDPATRRVARIVSRAG